MTSRRTEIAAAAARIIADEGIARASLREIAAGMGVTIGTLTHHFQDREDLLRTTFEATVRAARERAELAAHDLQGAPLLTALLAEALPTNNERRVEAAVWLAFSVSAITNVSHAAMCAELYGEWEDAVAAALSRTGVPARLARERARLLTAAADGIALRAMATPALAVRDQKRLLETAIKDAMRAV